MSRKDIRLFNMSLEFHQDFIVLMNLGGDTSSIAGVMDQGCKDHMCLPFSCGKTQPLYRHQSKKT